MCTGPTSSAANGSPAVASSASATARRKKLGGDQALGSDLGGGGGLNTLDTRRARASNSSPIAGISVSPAVSAFVRGGGSFTTNPLRDNYRTEQF